MTSLWDGSRGCALAACRTGRCKLHLCSHDSYGKREEVVSALVLGGIWLLALLKLACAQCKLLEHCTERLRDKDSFDGERSEVQCACRTTGQIFGAQCGHVHCCSTMVYSGTVASGSAASINCCNGAHISPSVQVRLLVAMNLKAGFSTYCDLARKVSPQLAPFKLVHLRALLGQHYRQDCQIWTTAFCALTVRAHACREGCVIYSFGSENDFSFEAEMLNRTVCDIHVFDPTVLPSNLRARETLLNGQLPRRRIWWHSVGISNQDNKSGSCVSTNLAALTCASERPDVHIRATHHTQGQVTLRHIESLSCCSSCCAAHHASN